MVSLKLIVQLFIILFLHDFVDNLAERIVIGHSLIFVVDDYRGGTHVKLLPGSGGQRPRHRLGDDFSDFVVGVGLVPTVLFAALFRLRRQKGLAKDLLGLGQQNVFVLKERKRFCGYNTLLASLGPWQGLFSTLFRVDQVLLRKFEFR